MTTGEAAHEVPADRGRGARLRAARQERGIGLRELARRLDVSPGHISQVERDLVAPSISLLYAIVSELGLSMDSLFGVDATGGPAAASSGGGDGATGAKGATVGDPSIPRTPGESRYVQRFDTRKSIEVEPGVQWQLLTPTSEAGVDFREIVYARGVEGPGDGGFIRHTGHEYGLVLEGRLHVQVEFDEFVLGPGDSIGFDSSKPHRFWSEGRGPARAIWFSNVGP